MNPCRKSGASELIAVVQIAMLAGLPYTALRDAILTHPTMAEGLTVLFANPPSLPAKGVRPIIAMLLARMASHTVAPSRGPVCAGAQVFRADGNFCGVYTPSVRVFPGKLSPFYDRYRVL